MICAQCRCINNFCYLWNQHFYIMNVRRHLEWKNTANRLCCKGEKNVLLYIRISPAITSSIQYYYYVSRDEHLLVHSSFVYNRLGKIFTWKIGKTFARFNSHSQDQAQHSWMNVCTNPKSLQLYAVVSFLHSLELEFYSLFYV